MSDGGNWKTLILPSIILALYMMTIISMDISNSVKTKNIIKMIVNTRIQCDRLICTNRKVVITVFHVITKYYQQSQMAHAILYEMISSVFVSRI